MHCSPQHTTCPYDTIDDDTTPTILITTSLICLYLTTSRHRLLISSSPTPNGSSVSPRSSGTSPPRVASPLALHCSSRILSQKFVASPRLVFVPFVCFVNLCTIIAYPSASIVSFRVRVVTTLPLPYPTLPYPTLVDFSSSYSRVPVIAPFVCRLDPIRAHSLAFHSIASSLSCFRIGIPHAFAGVVPRLPSIEIIFRSCVFLFRGFHMVWLWVIIARTRYSISNFLKFTLFGSCHVCVQGRYPLYSSTYPIPLPMNCGYRASLEICCAIGLG